MADRAYLSQAGFCGTRWSARARSAPSTPATARSRSAPPASSARPGALAALLTLDPPLAHRLYADLLRRPPTFSAPSASPDTPADALPRLLG